MTISDDVLGSIIDIAGSRENMTQPLNEFASAFQSLIERKDLTCLSSNTTYEGTVPPCVAVVDVNFTLFP